MLGAPAPCDVSSRPAASARVSASAPAVLMGEPRRSQPCHIPVFHRSAYGRKAPTRPSIHEPSASANANSRSRLLAERDKRYADEDDLVRRCFYRELQLAAAVLGDAHDRDAEHVICRVVDLCLWVSRLDVGNRRADT